MGFGGMGLPYFSEDLFYFSGDLFFFIGCNLLDRHFCLCSLVGVHKIFCCGAFIVLKAHPTTSENLAHACYAPIHVHLTVPQAKLATHTLHLVSMLFISSERLQLWESSKAGVRK